MYMNGVKVHTEITISYTAQRKGNTIDEGHRPHTYRANHDTPN